MYKNGFLLGKFFPFSMGHAFLIESALTHCEHLTVLVATIPKEFFNGAKLYHFYSVNNIKISGDDIIFKNVYDYPPMINNNIKNWLSTLIK